MLFADGESVTQWPYWAHVVTRPVVACELLCGTEAYVSSEAGTTAAGNHAEGGTVDHEQG